MKWHKSSFSGSNSNCVEVRNDLRAVRDSKHPATSLPLPREAVRRLVAAIK